jgi:hypothetical protein
MISAYQIHIAEAKQGCELTAQGGEDPNINLGASSEASTSSVVYHTWSM